MGLPYIDEQRTAVEAPPETTWRALIETLSQAEASAVRTNFARLLGCAPAEPTGTTGEEGSTLPGFRVAAASPPSRLALRGRHRFSDYALDFEVGEKDKGSTLRATTHAAFPGLRGEVYKSFVVRSRVHSLVTRRMLGAIKKQAEDVETVN